MHSLDIILILAFLAINVMIGFRHRGQNQTFIEYAIGDKKFSTAVLTATIVATWMSGSIFFIALENTYTQGLYYVIACVVGSTAGLLITGLVVGQRMGKFLDRVSVPDILSVYYGHNVQAISGISTVLQKVGYLAIQFKAISKITEILLGHTGPEVTIVTAALVIFYSTSGGVKAVTFTDVVQFFTFGALLPLLALAVWNRMESAPLQVATVLNNDPRFSFREVVQWTPSFKATLVLMCYYMTPSLPTQIFQRMAMARNARQMKHSFIWATILCLAADLSIMWIALLLLSDQPGLETDQLVPYMVQTYAYPGLKGLLGIGIIALAMSTADSVLNSTAVVIANDIFPRLAPKYKASIGTAKIATLGFGFAALLLSLQKQDLLNMVLFSNNFYAPVVVVPILLTVFGFQTSRRVVLLAMGAGFVTVVSCLLYSHSVNSFFPGMLVNLAVMLGAHYWLDEKGGWGHNPLPKATLRKNNDV